MIVWWDRQEDARRLCEENKEVWVPVGERYAVSNYGRAMSSAQGVWKAMKLTPMPSGYVTMNLGADSGLAHRIVVQSFDGTPPTAEHTDVRHLDGVKTNNELTNLRYGTRSENMLDVVRHKQEVESGVRENMISAAKTKGTWYGGRTWDSDLVQLLFTMEAEMKITLTDVARILDVGRDVIQNMALGRSHGHMQLPYREAQPRRSPQQKAVIEEKLRMGWSVAMINELGVAVLGKPLTHQDAYYYKSKLGLKD